jgi:hypothetical protein
LLKTKTKPHFDRTVTERSKAFFTVFQGANRGRFSGLLSCFNCPVGRGPQLVKAERRSRESNDPKSRSEQAEY